MLGHVTIATVVASFLYAPLSHAAETPSPTVKMERDISEERDKAIRGGYEDKLDKAIEQYGGTRTKEVIGESERIRHGGGQGSGHDGDSAQPGLTGTEGVR